MAKKKNPLVFMDVSIDGDPFERIVFELLYDVAPKTAENFRALCTGEKGICPNTGKSLHYKGSFFHRIVKGSFVQAGDFANQNGNSGESIYGSDFSDESSRLKHDAPGLLSMATSVHDTLGSHFIITLKADHHLDRKHVVFGKLVLGHNILKKIEDVGDEEGRPTVTVKIVNCGEYAEARHKGKHKKSSKDRRKRRRRYYSSESESSSDSDTESSETDSDSESDVSSSSDISSSSDDRRRKRKRSRKDKHRHGKRRNKRRDKRQRRRDKRSKRRLRRERDSDSDGESNRDVSFDGVSLHNQGKEQNHKDHSQQNGAKVRSPLVVVSDSHNKDRAVDIPETEEELPKENGKWLTNGTGAEYRSNGRGDRQPDVMDYHSGKSRSRSMSPKRPMSNCLSISARRSQSRSPSVTPKKRFIRGPTGSRSPPARRSVSRSPVRSISRIPSKSISRSPVRGRKRSLIRSPVRAGKGRSLSRSPARGGKGISVNRSPVRGRKDRSVSRSPVRSRKGISVSRSPVRSRSLRSVSKSPVRFSSRSHRSSPRASSRKTISRSPVRASRRGISRSPVRSPSRSLSRSPGRVLSRRDISRSPVRAPSRSNRRSYSRSPSPVRRTRTPRGRSVSRSVSPAASPKRVRRGRVFSERYSYARRYNTPSWSPVRSYRYNGRDRDRYSSYRRYSPRRYRSPPRRARTPPRYRSRRTPSVSPSPRYRAGRFSRSRSPVSSRSPIEPHRSHPSSRGERRLSSSRSKSPSKSRSSMESQSPRKASRYNRSQSPSSRSPDGKKGLVSYGDGSPYSG